MAPDSNNASDPAIVFDSDCSFCQRQMRRIRAHAAPGAFRFVPSNDPALDAMFPQLKAAGLATSLRYVEPGGRVHVGADAVYQISRKLSFFRWFTWIYRAPGLRSVLKCTYAVIARNRQRLGGRRSCAIDDD